MKIRELIRKRLDSAFNVFNREGVQIPSTQVRSEYQAIRQYLLDHHSEAHDCIAIKQHKDYRYFLTMLACMEIGIPYIPMKYDYPLDRVDQIKEASDFTLLIDDTKVAELIAYTGKKKTQFPDVTPDRNLYIIFKNFVNT